MAFHQAADKWIIPPFFLPISLPFSLSLATSLSLSLPLSVCLGLPLSPRLSDSSLRPEIKRRRGARRSHTHSAELKWHPVKTIVYYNRNLCVLSDTGWTSTLGHIDSSFILISPHFGCAHMCLSICMCVCERVFHLGQSLWIPAQNQRVYV